MDEFDIKLGGWLEEQRKARHLSQAEVARRMNAKKGAPPVDAPKQREIKQEKH